MFFCVLMMYIFAVEIILVQIMKRTTFLLCLLLALFYGCIRSGNERLVNALKQAERNGVELKKVLDYYSRDKADSLEYKAVCFFIKNMPYYSYKQDRVWDESSWNKNLAFDVFCETIIPYRVNSESLECWREYYYTTH